jgi:hypothetical protein
MQLIRSGVAGAALADLLYDGFEEAAVIGASGVLIEQNSDADAAIRSIWVAYWSEERPGGACCACLRTITHNQISRKKRGRFWGDFAVHSAAAGGRCS